VRLQGRFTLWFSLAAVIPIAVAALVTREVVSRSYRGEHDRARSAAEQAVRREVEQLSSGVGKTVKAMADRNHHLVGGLLQDLKNDGGQVTYETSRRLKEEALPMMRAVDLDVLLLVDAEDVVLVAPHFRGATGDIDPAPAQHARAREGKPYFAMMPTMDSEKDGAKAQQTLVVASARIASDGPYRVTVLGGRAVTADVLGAVRQQPELVDARIVDDAGAVIFPGAAEEGWSGGHPMRIALTGVDDKAPVAWIEIALSDKALRELLLRVTLVSVILALAALVPTVLVGLWVARRMTGDLDKLVVGAEAAARGDLDHRVDVRSTDEVGSVANAFNLMMEDMRVARERLVIAERIAAWQEIARRLAHEIKNPLTPIQMAMDTLRKTWKKKHPAFDEIFEESTSTVLEEAERLKRIVSEFSDFARMPKPTIGPCDLNELVNAALALYEGTVTIERRLAANLPPIDADKDQLSQVLFNLLENAREALAGKGGPASASGSSPGFHADARITVETRRGEDDDRVLLVIDDSGPGIAAEIRDKMFTPYFTTKHGKGGTGLGLAIVHRVIADHGGRIVSADAPGGGARFVIELPVKHGDDLRSTREKTTANRG
jgi:two-component system nitrogen regulation sensor histidine kinase NtrY